MKTLDALNKNELLLIIKKLMQISDDNKLFVQTSLTKEKKYNINLYKNKITKALDYDFPNIDWDFDKVINILKNLENAIDNSLFLADVFTHAVVQGQRLTNELGDIDESYYNSMCELYERAAHWIVRAFNDTHDIEYLREELRKIMLQAQDIGWGYGDEIEDLWNEHLKSLIPDSGE